MTSKSATSALANNELQMQNILQYIEDYVDLIENVPNEVIRQVTQLHEQNHQYNQLSVKLKHSMKLLIGSDSFDSDVESDHENNNCSTSAKATNNDGLRSTKGSIESLKLTESEKNTSVLIVPTSSSTTKINGKCEVTDEMRTKAMFVVQRCLLEMQEISDDKLQIAQSILDHLDLKGRVLDSNFRAISISGNLSAGSSSSSKSNHVDTIGQRESSTQAANDEHHHHSSKNDAVNSNEAESTGLGTTNASSKRSSSRRNFSGGKADADSNGTTSNTAGGGAGTTTSGKRGVKRGVKGANAKESMKRNKGGASNHAKDALNNSPNALYDEPPIDPDEPTYCLCEQVSFGEMICCDNSACAIEWFHFSCVALSTKPKGKWYCPNCRGDRSNIPKK